MLMKRELFQCGLPAVPGTPAPEFDGKTGNGFWADTLAQIDSYTGGSLMPWTTLASETTRRSSSPPTTAQT
jgi:hypothetical protein